MNKWWLNLYTIPLMRKMVFLLPIVFVLDGMLHYLNVLDLNELREYLPLTFLFFVFHHMKSDLAGNFLFHKLSIKLPELTKAFFAHYTLTFVCQIMLILIYDFVSSIYHSPFSQLIYTPTEALSHLILYYVAQLSFGIVLISAHIRQRRIALSASKRIQIFVGMSVLLVYVFGVILFLSLFKLGFVSIIFFVVPLMLAIGFNLPQLFYEVHLLRSEVKFKTYLKTMPLGLILSLGIFFGIAFLGRSDFRDTSLSAAQRVSLHFKWSPLSGDLDAETFKELVRNVPPLAFQHVGHLYSFLPKEELKKVKIQDFISGAEKSVGEITLSQDSVLRLTLFFKYSGSPGHIDELISALNSGKYKFNSTKDQAFLLSIIEEFWNTSQDPAYARFIAYKNNFERDRSPASK